MNSELIVSNKKDEFGCTLFIDTEGDNPKVITELLDIEASEYLIKGSQKYNRKTNKAIEGKFNAYNLWIYKISKQYGKEGVYLNDSLQMMLAFLEENKESFFEILHKYPKNHILCYAYFYDPNPYFKFDKSLIERLNYFNIDVEFDIYCLAE